MSDSPTNGEVEEAIAWSADTRSKWPSLGDVTLRHFYTMIAAYRTSRATIESLRKELATLKSLEQQAWHKAQFETDRAAKAEAKSQKDVEWAKTMRQSYEDELTGLKQLLRIERDILRAAERERDEARAKLDEIYKVRDICANQRDEAEAKLSRAMEVLEGAEKALKDCGHWSNESLRLYKDTSQSIVARNFQVENFAKATFDRALSGLAALREFRERA